MDMSNPYRIMPDITLGRIRTQDQNALLEPKNLVRLKVS